MPPPTPKAILFDLDDTILDTTDSATRVWQMTAREFAPRLGLTPEAIETVMSRIRDWYWSDPQRNAIGRLDLDKARADVADLSLKELGIDDAKLAQQYADFYTLHRIDAMRPFPGAIQTLQHFRGHGIAMALLTNGKAQTQRRKVELFELEPYFNAVLIEGEFGCGKPDERIFREALAACRAEPHEAWCVGDNLQWEVAAPQAMGMQGIWVDWQGKGLPSDTAVQPSHIVRLIQELSV